MVGQTEQKTQSNREKNSDRGFFCGFTVVFLWFYRGFLWFDCVFLWSGQTTNPTPKTTVKPPKTTVMSCFFDGHWVTEGEPLTVNPHARATSHKPLATHTQHTHNIPRTTSNTHQPHSHTTTQPHNHEAIRTIARQVTPTSQTKPSKTVPHDTTPYQVTPRQNRPRQKQARPNQARP